MMGLRLARITERVALPPDRVRLVVRSGLYIDNWPGSWSLKSIKTTHKMAVWQDSRRLDSFGPARRILLRFDRSPIGRTRSRCSIAVCKILRKLNCCFLLRRLRMEDRMKELSREAARPGSLVQLAAVIGLSHRVSASAALYCGSKIRRCHKPPAALEIIAAVLNL